MQQGIKAPAKVKTFLSFFHTRVILLGCSASIKPWEDRKTLAVNRKPGVTQTASHRDVPEQPGAAVLQER